MKKNKILDEVALEEISFTIKKMNEFENNPEKQLFYFSAIYGAFQKSLHYKYSDDALFLYVNLNNIYQYFNERLIAVNRGDTILPISKEDFDLLIKLSSELLDDFLKGSDYIKTLKKMIVLAYSLHGNGHFLKEKGTLILK